MFSKSLSAVAALAGVASALHLPTPGNSYFGNLRTTLLCSVLETDLVGLTLDSFAAALIPSVAEQGQSFYVNDVAANLTIPAAVASALGLLVDHVNTRVFIELALPGFSPDPILIDPQGAWINGTRFVAGQPAYLEAPQNGGVIGGLGPIQATGAPGTLGTIYVQNATAQLYLYGGAGLLLKELTLVCERPPYAAVLATQNIVARTQVNQPVLSPQNGYLVDYPELAEQDKFICYGIQYTGAIGSGASQIYQASTCGGLHAYTEEADINSFVNSTTQIIFNSTQVAALKKQYPGATSVDLTLQHYLFSATNGAPASADGAGSQTTTQTYALPSSGSLTVDLGTNEPGEGLTFGPFTATGSAANGDILFFVPGAITATYNFKNSAGASVGSTTATFNPTVPGFTGPGANIVPAGATKNPNLTGL